MKCPNTSHDCEKDKQTYGEYQAANILQLINQQWWATDSMADTPMCNNSMYHGIYRGNLFGSSIQC